MGTRAERKRKLELQTVLFLRRRYKLLAEYSMLEPANPAQQTSFDAWKAWVASVYTELALRLAEVDSAPDEATWDAIRIDRTALRTSDPRFKLRDFLQL